MKSFTKILFAALFAGSTAASTSTAAYAQRWLAAHPQPQGDQLAELKDVNPTAYAIVKALLTKRSLGLLDPKHPTASFAPAAPKADEGDAPQGAAAFALSAQDEAVASKKQGADSSDSDAAAVYPEAVPVHAHHDWLNWKPSDSATDDEAMVKGVLGEVGSLVGAKKAAPVQSEGSALSGDEAAFAADFPQALPAAPAAPAATEAPAATTAAPQGNNYLRGLADDSAPRVAVAAPAAGGPLASFSWSDDNTAPVAATTEAPAAPPAPKKKRSALNVFDSWLNGGGSPHAKAASAPAAQAAATTTQNPYTAGLW